MNQGRATLFSHRQVGIATFLGTPLCGLSLIAINYVRIGQYGKAISSFILGMISLCILYVMSATVLSWVPALIQFLLAVLAMHFIAKRMQEAIFIENLAYGGKKSGLLALWFWSFFTLACYVIVALSLIYLIDT